MFVVMHHLVLFINACNEIAHGTMRFGTIWHQSSTDVPIVWQLVLLRCHKSIPFVIEAIIQ